MRTLAVVVLAFAALLALVTPAIADVYMHNMRGSNNRLNEANNNRNNANRLFDSQNNDRGGYNVGDVGAAGSDQQGQLRFYEGSLLRIEWTNQHGCGVNHNNLDCQMVLQYMCEDTGGGTDGSLAAGVAGLGWQGTQTTPMRDGSTTNTINQNAPDDETRGRHEPQGWYDHCTRRERNKGLFLAEEDPNGDEAIYTRQDDDGTQYGYECPEERDYYPYWHPTPWIDIAVLTSDPSQCRWYEEHSNNNNAYGYCPGNPESNNSTQCAAAGATWVTYSHADLGGALAPPAVDCQPGPWTRDNHLGDIEPENVNSGAVGYNAFYDWTIPRIGAHQTCVLRIRYNITTGDYRGHPANNPDNFADWRLNDEASPVQNDPTVDTGIEYGLRLAVDTSQFGRTFQDRSHIFEIVPRPGNVGNNDRIYNLNIRGKRGNIVQVYPAVEYDFTPNVLEVSPSDWVHIHWTGSNTNDNGNDGQGAAGTDKNNLVQIESLNHNFPLPLADVTMFANQDDAVNLASVGCLDDPSCTTPDGELNDRPATYDAGLFQFPRGTYYFMCSRNNNFSNRSQKGTIVSN